MCAKTILVADDESHVLNTVSQKLQTAGYRVLMAHDGREALDLAQHQHPDLIITDYHMPQLSGLELCRQLKQEVTTSDIPAIMLTAHGYDLGPQNTGNNGILRTVAKPFSPRQLLSVVNEVLGVMAA